MEYNNTAPFSGNPEKALELSLSVFLIQGFAIIEKSVSGYELEGRGFWTVRQKPLMAATRVKVSIEDKRIALSAEFAPLRNIQNSIPWLAGTTMLLIGLDFLDRDAANSPLNPSSWTLYLPFLLLLSVVSRRVQKRAERALDTMLKNMSAVR